MQMKVFPTGAALAEAAAQDAAQALRQLIASKGRVRLVAATGAAQFQFLKLLTSAAGIAWEKVELFQLDEHLGGLSGLICTSCVRGTVCKEMA